MIKRGQCSNSPSKCSNAANGTLLAYAGTNSICPECGAPLALVAGEGNSAPQPSTPPPINTQRQPPPPAQDYEDDYEDEKPNQALEFAKMAAMFVVVAGLVFFGLRYFTSRGENNQADIGNETTNQISVGQMSVADINPSLIANTASIIDVKASPSESAQSLGKIGVGVGVEINGKVNVDGIDWYRIMVPNQSGQTGYVKVSDVVPIDGGSLLTNQVTAAPVVSEVSEIPETIFYISGDKANIRDQAGLNGKKVAEMLRGDTLSASATRTVDGKTWYRVNLPTGGQGWISSSLLSRTPVSATPEITTDSAPKSSAISEGSNVVFTFDKVKVRQSPDAAATIDTDETQKGMVVLVDEVQTSGGSTWYHVHSNRFNIDGWVDAKSVKQVEN